MNSIEQYLKNKFETYLTTRQTLLQDCILILTFTIAIIFIIMDLYWSSHITTSILTQPIPVVVEPTIETTLPIEESANATRLKIMHIITITIIELLILYYFAPSNFGDFKSSFTP